MGGSKSKLKQIDLSPNEALKGDKGKIEMILDKEYIVMKLDKDSNFKWRNGKESWTLVPLLTQW